MRAASWQCSNLCPDEKGTERIPDVGGCNLQSFVATYAPMKRGLKDNLALNASREVLCSNLCPDEKGTERKYFKAPITANISSNLCPDEKGTERFANERLADLI